MSQLPADDPILGDARSCEAIEKVIVPRSHDLGGFQVRQALPAIGQRMVGPFIFFDQMGPAEFHLGEGLDVRPHPHIGLSTVTYLFDGRIRHRDSLGTEMVISPGDVNLMTAGRGIVHSERTPEELRGAPMSMSGLQTWIALPDRQEEMAPVFENTAGTALPEFSADGVSGRLIIGELEGRRAPVTTYHDTLYADIRLEPGARYRIAADAEERAIYVLGGLVTISGDSFPENRLLVFRPGDEIVVETQRETERVVARTEIRARRRHSHLDGAGSQVVHGEVSPSRARRRRHTRPRRRHGVWGRPRWPSPDP